VNRAGFSKFGGIRPFSSNLELKMKLFALISVLGCLLSAHAFGDTRTQALADQYKLNQATPQALAEARLGDKVIGQQVHTMRAYYSFAVQGGASAATVTLRDATTDKPAVLPKGAIVRDCLIDVITPGTTSTSATMALSTGQSAGDLKAALAAASYSGLVACIPVGTAASAIKLTADRTMTGTIAVGTFTAGKWYVIIHYELSDTL
jgi:hypothetical protein